MEEVKGVVITGATGAIGIALTKLYSRKNIPVMAIIREHSERRKYIEGLPNVRILECNLARIDDLMTHEISNMESFDVIYHLAWEGSDRESRNIEEIQSRNIEYTEKVIDFANRIGCRIFIGAGSQAEYGVVEGVIDEEYPCNPFLEYGKAKLQAEESSRRYCDKLEIIHIWTRIFSVYGPGMGDDSLVTYAMHELLNGRHPKSTLGEQVWDYLYSDDAAYALYLLALSGKNQKTYNIAYGEGKTVKEYLEIIQKVVNPSVEMKYGEIPYSSNQIMKLVGDISKLNADTGFVPRISFEEGIRQMKEWMLEK